MKRDYMSAVKSDSAADIDLHALGDTVTRSIAALVSRTVALQLVILCGNIALLRLLNPRDFGIFAIVTAVLEMVVFFGNTGIGGALVRQTEEPSDVQLSSVFFFQVGVAGLLLAVIASIAGLMPLVWHDLPASAPLLIRVLAL